jgi:DEAD/DEAH box helicase domain-containing protein
LNTVLAFVTSRKHIATTFPVVRSSVENLLKRPLELSQVAELKALLPDLINFAYIPHNDLRVNAPTQSNLLPKTWGRSPDFSMQNTASKVAIDFLEPEEHVLVLEFVNTSKRTLTVNSGTSFALPPSLTPTGMKKLVESRNERFSLAVNELLQATPDTEDPVALLRAAGRDHIPVDPGSKLAFPAAVPEPHEIPSSETRPSIDNVIEEIQAQDWYRDQIVERRVFEQKKGQIVELDPPLSKSILQALESSRNITSLYSHQVAAISALMSGRNVIVSTSTASGKSVIYQVPLLKFLQRDEGATAIFIYPTKVS